MHNRFAFIGGDRGRWRVSHLRTLRGEALPEVDRLDVLHAGAISHGSPVWRVEGLISNLRYTTRAEVMALQSKQEPLGRDESRSAAVILLKKSPSWWALAQDERRTIFEQDSKHTTIGMSYLPAIARQLYHSRDLGEPFDFVTWFEYRDDATVEFDELVTKLRASREWTYVDREVDVRLVLQPSTA